MEKLQEKNGKQTKQKAIWKIKDPKKTNLNENNQNKKSVIK